MGFGTGACRLEGPYARIGDMAFVVRRIESFAVPTPMIQMNIGPVSRVQGFGLLTSERL